MVVVPRWLPNAISALRIALVPAWLGCVEVANRTAEQGADAGPVQLLAVAVIASIGASDFVDGFLARRFHLQTHVGAVLDALADKLAQVAAFTYLALRPGPAFAAVPVWFLLLLIGRDAVLLVGCGLVRWRVGRVRIVHRVHGKVASVLLFALSIVCTAGFGDHLAAVFGGTAALVAASTVLYVRDGVRQALAWPAEVGRRGP